tara:strand:- start:661 stop:828 length:168 start_codon:yes stop_codon:yes gene_type:complete
MNDELVDDFIASFQMPLQEFCMGCDEEELQFLKENITERFTDGNYDLVHDINNFL